LTAEIAVREQGQFAGKGGVGEGCQHGGGGKQAFHDFSIDGRAPFIGACAVNGSPAPAADSFL
jgi:hypothetical protein